MTDQLDKEKELIEKLKGMTEQEILDYYKTRPMKKYNRLNFAYVKIHMLLDYIEVINNNPDQLTSPGNRVSAASGKLSPSGLLWSYIILEICSFYEFIDSLLRQGIQNLPTLPAYRQTLMDCRNQVIAHLDYEGNLETTAAWFEQFMKVEQIGLDIILKDFDNYYNACRSLFPADM